MEFQDTSMHGSKVTGGIKSVTNGRTNGQANSNMPDQLFQSWGHNEKIHQTPLNEKWTRPIYTDGIVH